MNTLLHQLILSLTSQRSSIFPSLLKFQSNSTLTFDLIRRLRCCCFSCWTSVKLGEETRSGDAPPGLLLPSGDSRASVEVPVDVIVTTASEEEEVGGSGVTEAGGGVSLS